MQKIVFFVFIMTNHFSPINHQLKIDTQLRKDKILSRYVYKRDQSIDPEGWPTTAYVLHTATYKCIALYLIKYIDTHILPYHSCWTISNKLPIMPIITCKTPTFFRSLLLCLSPARHLDLPLEVEFSLCLPSPSSSSSSKALSWDGEGDDSESRSSESSESSLLGDE